MSVNPFGGPKVGTEELLGVVFEPVFLDWTLVLVGFRGGCCRV